MTVTVPTGDVQTYKDLVIFVKERCAPHRGLQSRRLMQIHAPAHQRPGHAPAQKMFEAGMLLREDFMHHIGMDGAELKGLSDAPPELNIRKGHVHRKRARDLGRDEAVKRKRRQSEEEQQDQKHTIEYPAKKTEQLEHIGPLHG